MKHTAAKLLRENAQTKFIVQEMATVLARKLGSKEHGYVNIRIFVNAGQITNCDVSEITEHRS